MIQRTNAGCVQAYGLVWLSERSIGIGLAHWLIGLYWTFRDYSFLPCKEHEDQLSALRPIWMVDSAVKVRSDFLYRIPSLSFYFSSRSFSPRKTARANFDTILSFY